MKVPDSHLARCLGVRCNFKQILAASMQGLGENCSRVDMMGPENLRDARRELEKSSARI